MAESFFRVRKGIIVANTTAGANLDPISLTIGSTLVNATHIVSGTVNATILNTGTFNATSMNATSINATSVNAATHSVGTLFTANSILVNAAAINLTGQVNAASFFATTSGNVGANVQLTTSSLHIGNASINTFANSSTLRVITVSANGSVGAANQALLSNGTTSFWGNVEMLGVSRAQNYQSGTTYTLVLTDAGKNVIIENAATHTLTIPTNASVAFPVDSYINFIQLGAGLVHFANAVGVTLNSRNGTNTAGQYAIATITKVATDRWVLGGDVV